MIASLNKTLAGGTWSLFVSSLLVFSGTISAQDDFEDESDPAEHLVQVVKGTLKQKRRRRPSVLGNVDLKRASSHVRRVARTLRGTKVTLELDQQSVGELLSTLSEISDLTFILSGKARRALKKTPVKTSIDVKNLSLEHLLNLLSDRMRTYRFVIRYGAVFLVRDTEYKPKKTLRVYNVRDLIRRPRHFRAPKMALGSKSAI